MKTKDVGVIGLVVIIIVLCLALVWTNLPCEETTNRAESHPVIITDPQGRLVCVGTAQEWHTGQLRTGYKVERWTK